MRLAVLVAVLALPAPLAAQSFYLRSGELIADGASVGSAVTARVSLEGGSAQVAKLAFEGRAVRVRAAVDLAQARLQAGVGRDTALGGTAFATRMTAGAWAPVLGVASTSVRIALPPGAPSRDASLPLGSSAARRDPVGLPWSYAPRHADDATLHCVDFSLVARPGAETSWAPADIAPRVRVATARGWDTIEVSLDGFVVVGYRLHAARCGGPAEPSGLGITGGTGAGDGWGQGRVVILPAGTTLHATATATVPFATLRVRAYGIEPLHSATGRACDGAGHCRRVPALPTGTAQWIVPVDDPSGARFVLTGYVRVPAETLADAPPGHGDFGLVSSYSPDWPTP